MKKRNILTIGTLFATLAVSVGLSIKPGNAMQAKADGEYGPYSIAESSYEVAMLESYLATADTSSTDLPLGEKLLAQYLYDSGSESYSGTMTRSLDAHRVSDERLNPSLEWKIDCFKPFFNSGVMRFLLRAGTSSINMYDSTQFGEGTDEYALTSVLQAADPTYTVRGGAMISNTVMTDIQDISIFWRYTDCRRFFVCYQLENTTEWKILTTFNMQDSGIIEGNYRGTRGWDAYGFTTFNLDNWNTHELKGANAKIAFVASHNTFEGNMQLSSLLINANKTAVRYLNYLSCRDKLCTTEGGNYKDLHLTKNENSHVQDLFQLVTEKADPSFLASYTVKGTKTTEKTALGLYNHFVSTIPGLGNVKVPNASVMGGLFSGNSTNATIVLVCALTIATIGFSAYFILRKKRA